MALDRSSIDASFDFALSKAARKRAKSCLVSNQRVRNWLQHFNFPQQLGSIATRRLSSVAH